MIRHAKWIYGALALAALSFSACKDPYYYDDREPDWLGASIYDFLSHDGRFDYFCRIIDSCNYTSVLQRTGSKTMFVCTDSAFKAYFANNDDGIRCFEDFDRTMMNRIMEYAMVNDANLIELLSSGPDYLYGQVMRRTTSLDPLDLVSFEKEEQLPDPTMNSYFAPYINKGMYLLNDNNSPYLVQFFQPQMDEKRITDEDFSILFNGATRKRGDAHLFDKKVVERDITCKNGYVHILDGLLLPQPNMAQFIREDDDLSTFNSLLDRYSAPYPLEGVTATYRELHPDFPMQDTLYERRYFSATGGATSAPNGGGSISSDKLLLFNPGWNAYHRNAATTDDMAAMFVPSNEAMKQYFSPEGEGSFMFLRYKVWDSVPDDIAAMFVNSHMQYSFTASLPSKFNGLTNEDGDEMFIKPENVERARVTTNGAVYVVNRVFPPIDYVSVMAPVLVTADTRVFNYAVRNLDFRIYLRSMESAYNPDVVPPFTFIVPRDGYLGSYIYPSAQGHSIKEMLVFRYDETYGNIETWRYTYDEATGQPGEYINKFSSEKETLDTRTQALINEIMDYHIIVDSIYPGQEYYETKGKGFIRVVFDDPSDIRTAHFLGGGNMEQNMKWGHSNSWLDEKQVHDSYTVNTDTMYHLRNGNTYFVDGLMQQPLTSVYQALSKYNSFKEFFNDLRDVVDPKYAFFQNVSGYSGLSMNISFYSAYHYTLYVPTNEAMQKAHAAGLPTWDEIAATTDANLKTAKTEKLVNFLKYHFQDNSVFIKGKPVRSTRYETATKNAITGKFYNLNVTQDGEDIYLVPTVAQTNGLEKFVREPVKVRKDEGLYNIMCRDYFFSGKDITTVEASANDYSARTTIHQIDGYLNYIKAPVVSHSYSINPTNVRIRMSVSDNGDGVAFDKNVITHRGICWSRTPNPTYKPGATSGQVELDANSDIVTNLQYFVNYPESTSPSDTLLYIRSYAVSKWAVDGTDTSLPANASKEPLVGYSNEICINTKEGKKAN